MDSTPQVRRASRHRKQVRIQARIAWIFEPGAAAEDGVSRLDELIASGLAAGAPRTGTGTDASDTLHAVIDSSALNGA